MCALLSPTDPGRAGTGLTHDQPVPRAGPTSPGPCLRVRLLGGFTLAWGETSLPPIAGLHARSLLAYLITHRDRPHTRDLLAGAFWPELPDARARRRLSHALWQIGRVLPARPGCALHLLTGADTVQFNTAAPYWLDVEEFERLAGRGLRGRDTRPGGRSAGLPLLRAAADLYQGDLLAGFYDDWLLAERERLRELFLAVLLRLLSRCRATGAYEEGLGYAQRLVAEDPLHEEGHREVMRLCLALGRRHEALQQYARCRAILSAELGVEPAAATNVLYQEIIARGAETEAPYLPQAAGVRPAPLLEGPGQAALVGRARERAALVGQLEQAAAGRGGLVLIEGEAGVGKTRLLHEIARDAGWRGIQALWGRGRELAGPAPYGPLAEALRAGLSPLRAGQLAQLVEGAWLQEASLLLPELHGGRAGPAEASPPDRDSASGAQQRSRLLEALAHVVRALGEITPHLLILEDLHWAGEDTFGALTHLAAHLPASHVLVIGSYRSGEARASPAVWEALQALDRTGYCGRLELALLTARETGELVRRGLGLAQPAPYFAARLHRETAGNPLFLLETLRALHDEGLLYRDGDGAWSTPWDEITADYAELPLPAGVRQVISGRVARLAPAERALLDTAAVLGAEFDLPIMLQASELERGACLAAAGGLVQRRFLSEEQNAYCFSHDQVRRVAYAMVPEAERALLHRRAGEALEGVQPQRVGDLAYHFAQGGVADKAVAYGLQAGDQAQSLYAYAGALARYDQALAVAGEDCPAARWDLLRRREEVLEVFGRRAEQAAALAEMLGLAGALGDARRRGVTLYRQGRLEVSTGSPRLGLARLQEACALAQGQGDPSLSGRCQVMIGRAYWHMGDAPRCLAAAQEAQALFRQANDLPGEVGALNLMGNLYLGALGQHERALRCFEQVLAIARELRHDDWEHTAGINLGVALMSLGCYDRSQELLSATSAFFTQAGNKPNLAAIAFAQGRNALGLADYVAARRFGERGLSLSLETGNLNFAIENQAVLGLAALYRGEPREALGHFAGALVDAQSGEQASDLAWLQSYRALAHLQLGEDEPARTLSAESAAILEAAGPDVPFPEVICFHRYQVLARLEGAEAAQPCLERAHQALMAQADTIEDPELRRSFLENVRENREIVAAYRARQAGARFERVRLPRAGASTGRPLRDDEWVEVTWTVAEDQDGAIGDKAGRRQHRVLRLLREARAQGAAPTVDALADALGVSRATIKRDLAWLREQGRAVPTRGTRGGWHADDAGAR